MKILLVISLLTSSTFSFALESNLAGNSNGAQVFNKAQVTFVSAAQQFDGSWCFNTSVKHNDEGWKHYANGWEILDIEGKQLWERPLTHPHVNEQPFTRRLCDIYIPSDIKKLVVRAKCNQHGTGDKTITLDLTTTQGLGYEVKRFD
ncbi:hypothetical protein GCM10009111_26990 [Colwellia asteriadis]|uniref:Uncharacterized protein n=1 Tax=Colwellia asteriadis TaxID=517723 RepID=A0ABN1L9D7_9GAMM